MQVPELISQLEMLNITPVELMVCMLALGISISIVIIVKMSAPHLKTLINAARFAYPNARIRAIGAPYVLADNTYKLLESKNVSELVSKLAEGGYRIDVSGEDVEEIERALNLALFKMYESTITRVPKGMRPFLKAYLMRFEVEQLKIAIKGKNVRLSPEEIKNKMIPVGGVTPALIEDVAEAVDVDRIIQNLLDTPYGKVLSNTVLDYEKTKSVLPLELALDNYVFQRLQKSVSEAETSMAELISKFVDTYADVANIKTALRAKREGLEPETTRKYMLSGGTFSERMLLQIAESRDVMGIVTMLEETRYAPLLTKAISQYEKTGSIYPFEAVLDKYLLHRVFDLARESVLGAGPVIKFTVAKDFEIRNIRAALHGIRERLSLEQMKDIVICEEGI